MEKYIEFQNITKIFPGQKALSDVSFSVAKGEVHALLGENGAGKSTLLNILHGMFPATEGKVFIEGKEVKFKNALDAIEFGIAKVHQEINIIPELSVAQNMMLGGEPQKGILLDRKKMEQETQVLLDRLGCDFKASDKVGLLSAGKKQMIQIAKALYLNARVISFDEPTSSLSNAEVNTLFGIIRELKEQGITILYISHKMDEILRISDEVTIMRDGQYIGTWSAKDLTTDFIITKMVGRELSELYPTRENVPGEVVFEVEDFTSINPKSFRHVSFQLKKGEILGVAGLVGAQRTELMEGLFGLRSHTAGRITYKGQEIRINQPKDAINNGIAMLTEDRRATGILGVLSIADNVSIASLNQYLIGGVMLDDAKIEKLVQENVAKLSIKTPSSKTQIQSLSGGNQQKVLISRWLANSPDVFIMDEPTRGIDVGAKYEIYCIIAEMAKQGKSIIMISSEMSELIGMSDRIMVMCDGRVTGFIGGDEANQENIMALATQFE